MNKRNSLAESPLKFLRIHIDDMSNIKPTNAKIRSEMMKWISGVDMITAEGNTYIVMPAIISKIVNIRIVLSAYKALVEAGDADIRHDSGEEALDMYYNAYSGTLYWDASHTNRVAILDIIANSPLQEEIEERIINAFGFHIISYNKGMMLIDAHWGYEAVMGKVKRICDMLAYEMSPSPNICNDDYLYVSRGDDFYISIRKLNYE